ncbi:EAL domain-containing protein [Cyanobacterium aponinum AL20118]|uniref:EAL domain-containing protein n=1 Tax=Cyanobacterium aponinum AL20115 TaxID=3090662 RepID=A0AAF0ZGG2_9CHRO|nr:EAL domain-containing protein [Cyanobacterium aponinum]WPF89697.1 EAL domain-containing protein [Cyanobacterium aponinum AL20115]
MDSKNKEKQERSYNSLTNLYESIYLTGNLDNINLNGETIDKPIALFRRDNFELISGNHLFQEKFVTSKSKPRLQDYIQPYTIREILGFSQGSCFLVKPLTNHNYFSGELNSCYSYEFELYNLSISTVTWKSEKVIAVIFHPLSTHSIIDCATRLSQLSSLISNLPVVVYQCRNDKYWTMDYISKNCWDLTGYEDQYLLNNTSKSYSSLIHPLDRNFVREETESAIASRTHFDLEYRIVSANGNIKWVWEKGKGIYAPTGELLYLVGIIQEITGKRRNEQEKSFLFDLTKVINTANNLETALLHTIQEICQITRWDFAEVWLPNFEGNVYNYSVAWYRKDNPYFDNFPLALADFQQHSYDFSFHFEEGLPGKVWAERKAIWWQNIHRDSHFRRKNYAKQSGLKTALGIPVMVGDEIIAIFVFFTHKSLSINNDLINFLETITSQLGSFLKQKQIETQLRQSQRQLANIVDSSLGVFFRISYNPQWGKDYISQGCVSLTGYTPNELMENDKINLVKITHPLDLQGVLDTIKNSLNKKVIYSIEYRIFTKDNQVKWLWEKGKGIFDESGQLLGIEGIITDIGDRPCTEKLLSQVEDRYRNFFENAVEGIFQTTIDGYYLSANKALAKIYGYDTPIQLIKNLNDIENRLYVQPHRRKQFVQLLEENEVISNFESEVYRSDGTTIWISENARAVRNVKGDLLYYEGTVEDITKYKLAQEKLHRQAFYDQLTQLPNRSLFMQKLSQCIDKLKQDSTNEYQFSILFLDCDRFKAVNDSLGHGVGDLLLIAIGERLRNCLGEKEIVARLGGDEFTILWDDIDNIKEIINLAEKINNAFKPPFVINKHQLFCGISIGIFFSSSLEKEQYNYLSPPQILQYADTALYKAKSQKRSYYQVFQGDMHNEALAELQLENEIRQGLEAEEFILYYQPIINLTNNQLKGFESLIRWNHPQKGIVTPFHFINLAEQTGLIIPIGLWVLKEGCKQLYKWHNHILNSSDNHKTIPIISINLSSQELNSEKFLPTLDNILKETQVNPEYIKLEITESSPIFQEQSTQYILDAIVDRNIQLWIDDFGTGYSSLSYLHRLPINGLKLDRCFVTDIETNQKKAKMIKAILSLAFDLGVEVIIEGVETEKQLEIIQEMGCIWGQGYLFSHPLPPEKAGDILLSSN